jgi:hypothetical protein
MPLPLLLILLLHKSKLLCSTAYHFELLCYVKARSTCGVAVALFAAYCHVGCSHNLSAYDEPHEAACKEGGD